VFTQIHAGAKLLVRTNVTRSDVMPSMIEWPVSLEPQQLAPESEEAA